MRRAANRWRACWRRTARGGPSPGAEPEAVAEVLFSLADGLALRMLIEPERDFTATMSAGIACARALLAD